MKNVVEKFATLGRGREITVEDIPLKLKLPLAYRLDETTSEVDFHNVMASTERELIVWAMQKARGNETQAARRLSMQPAAFRDTLARHQADITWEQD